MVIDRRPLFLRTVEQLDLQTKAVLKEFPGAAAAAASIGLHSHTISLCCLGKFGSAGGYRWRFKPDPAMSVGPPVPPRVMHHALLSATKVSPPEPVMEEAEKGAEGEEGERVMAEAAPQQVPSLPETIERSVETALPEPTDPTREVEQLLVPFDKVAEQEGDVPAVPLSAPLETPSPVQVAPNPPPLSSPPAPLPPKISAPKIKPGL
jgi:hypothetical protein